MPVPTAAFHAPQKAAPAVMTSLEPDHSNEGSAIPTVVGSLRDSQLYQRLQALSLHGAYRTPRRIAHPGRM